MTVETTQGQSVQITRTLFKGVQILATDGNISPTGPEFPYTMLTFALSPRDVNKLLFVLSQGAFFYLIFRYRKREGVPAEYVAGEIKSEKKWVTYPHLAVLVFDVVIIVLP